MDTSRRINDRRTRNATNGNAWLELHQSGHDLRSFGDHVSDGNPQKANTRGVEQGESAWVPQLFANELDSVNHADG